MRIVFFSKIKARKGDLLAKQREKDVDDAILF